MYKSRLTANLALRLYKERVVPSTLKERVALRWKNAKTLANQISCTTPKWTHQINYYAIVVAVFISPDTSAFLPNDGKAQVLTWATLITASIAGMGWSYAARKKRKERKKEKRKKRRVKRFFRKLKRFFKGDKRSCDGCSGCGESCGESCGEACGDCCSTACQSICEAINNSEYPCLWWLLIIGSLVLFTGVCVLIALLT